MGFVLDASVLIHFARADAWDLLEEVTGGDLLVPAAVLDETSLGRGPDAEAIRRRVGDRVAKNGVFAVDDDALGPGERAVLAGAVGGHTAVLDDRRGRRWAKPVGVHYTGTVGLLLRLRGRKDVQAAFERMLHSGMRLDAALAVQIMRLLDTP